MKNLYNLVILNTVTNTTRRVSGVWGESKEEVIKTHTRLAPFDKVVEIRTFEETMKAISERA